MPTATANFGFTKPDTGQTAWSGPVNTNFDSIDSQLAAPLGSINQVTSSTSPVFDLSVKKVHRIVLSMDATSPLFQNPVDGQPYKFIIIQDAVGGRTFNFNPSFKGAGKVAPSEGNTNPNSISVQVFTWSQADQLFIPWGLMITF